MPVIITHNSKRIDTPSFVNKLLDDTDVKSSETTLSSHSTIVAHNFTREVFRSTHSGKSRWTPITTAARGLFTNKDDIVGRGFEKFFTLGETRSNEEDINAFTYPVNAYKKLNGFLAIAFYTEEDGLIITNKSGFENDYHTQAIANEIIKNDVVLYERLENFLKEHSDFSITFEIIAPNHGDKHIVFYNKDSAVPLAIIDNKSGHITTSYDELFGIKPEVILENKNELVAFINKVSRDEHNLSEGYVLRGSNGFQLKLKTPFYLRAKSVRGRLDRKVPVHNINKLSWPNGGKKWFLDAAITHTSFSPEWALDKQANDNMARENAEQ